MQTEETLFTYEVEHVLNLRFVRQPKRTAAWAYAVEDLCLLCKVNASTFRRFSDGTHRVCDRCGRVLTRLAFAAQIYNLEFQNNMLGDYYGQRLHNNVVQRACEMGMNPLEAVLMAEHLLASVETAYSTPWASPSHIKWTLSDHSK